MLNRQSRILIKLANDERYKAAVEVIKRIEKQEL